MLLPNDGMMTWQ